MSNAEVKKQAEAALRRIRESQQKQSAPWLELAKVEAQLLLVIATCNPKTFYNGNEI